MAQVGEATVEIRADTEDVLRSLDEVERRAEEVASLLARVGNRMGWPEAATAVGAFGLVGYALHIFFG